MFQSVLMLQNWDAQLVSRLLQGFMTGTNISRIRAPKNPDRHIFCKHCNDECTGAEAGLADHLHKEHNLVGVCRKEAGQTPRTLHKKESHEKVNSL